LHVKLILIFIFSYIIYRSFNVETAPFWCIFLYIEYLIIIRMYQHLISMYFSLL